MDVQPHETIIHYFGRSFLSVYGKPIIDCVDISIFKHRYFTHCMSCTFCKDHCCSYGVDIDAENHSRIMARADEIEAFVGISRNEWFTGEWRADHELPGGSNTRTTVRNGRCVFLNRKERGCLLHTFALTNGFDYHEIKPMVSAIYPLTFNNGLLCPSIEVEERDLVCLDHGPTLYRGVRNELAYYFGYELLDELDNLESIYK